MLKAFQNQKPVVVEPPTSRRLPPELASRLRRIPRDETLCRDVDGRWASWMAGELDTRQALGIEEHLETCGRCREVCAALTVARDSSRELAESLPSALRHRLRNPVSRRRQVPWWLGDLRFALAASYLAAVVFGLAVGAAERDPGGPLTLDALELRESSGTAFVASVNALGGEVQGRTRQAIEASTRLGNELQKVAEDLFSAAEINRPAEESRPSTEEE